MLSTSDSNWNVSSVSLNCWQISIRLQAPVSCSCLHMKFTLCLISATYQLCWSIRIEWRNWVFARNLTEVLDCLFICDGGNEQVFECHLDKTPWKSKPVQCWVDILHVKWNKLILICGSLLLVKVLHQTSFVLFF